MSLLNLNLNLKPSSLGVLLDVMAESTADRTSPVSAEDGPAAQAAADGLVHVERLPARSATFGALSRPLPPAVAERLGTGALWSHQARTLDRVRDGTSVAVATGTASGKSLCYQAALAEAVADPLRPGTGLLCFPTKALAHDQLRALAGFDFPGLVPAAYDGDASPEQRMWARRHANVVLTNPEMLHYGVLPHHERWATFLMRLRYVVIDELHVLRGVFGTNVAHLLRRLRRVCAPLRLFAHVPVLRRPPSDEPA